MSKIHTTRRLSNKTQPMAFQVSPRSKSMLSVATVSGVLFLVEAIAPVFSIPQPTPTLDSNWQIAQTFRPPNRGAPRSTVGAGTRGECILDNQKTLTPITPVLSGRSLGLTVSTHPTFFGYIPRSRATSGELIIRDRTRQEIYRTSFAVPNQQGIVSISLPSTAKPLEIGQQYEWELVLDCGSGNKIISRSAWIERIQPSQTLTNQLQNATPDNLPALYANEGIWHEALANRVKLRTSQPKSIWERNWQQLLRTAGLGNFIREPLIDCCQLTSS